MNQQTKKLQAGFSLVELALIILIGGILLSSFMTMLLDYIEEAKLSTTRSRMAAIDAALGQYLANNGAYPCPASLTTPVDGAGYGAQVVTTPANDCYGSSTAPEAGTFRVTPTPTLNPAYATFIPPLYASALEPQIRIGAVPVRTLNLPDQYMNDGWNDRFYYAVTEILASPGDTSTTPLYNANGGAISVVDSASPANPVANPPGTAQYVIISSGQDRVGAYASSGAPSGLACDSTTLEGLNCMNGGAKAGTFRSTLLNGENAGANTFDDFVIYHTTSAQGVVPSGTIILYYTIGTNCPTGWATPSPVLPLGMVPPPTSNASPLPNYIYCQKQ